MVNAVYNIDQIKIGSKIKFNYLQELYEGIVILWEPKHERVTFDEVFNLTTNEPELGRMDFFQSDQIFKNIIFEEREQRSPRSPDSGVNLCKTESGKNRYQSSSNSLNLIEENHIKNFNEDACINHFKDDPVTFTESKISQDEVPFIIVSDIESAKSIVNFSLTRCETIGLRVYNLSRNQISLICLKINEFVYCFDLLTISKQDEDDSKYLIANILQLLSNPKFIKITHDFESLPSSFKKCSAKNLIDLDVSFKQLYKNRFGLTPTSSSNLQDLIKYYANDFVNQSCDLNWSKRPLSVHHITTFTKETGHLIKLYESFKALEKSNQSLNMLRQVFEPKFTQSRRSSEANQVVSEADLKSLSLGNVTITENESPKSESSKLDALFKSYKGFNSKPDSTVVQKESNRADKPSSQYYEQHYNFKPAGFQMVNSKKNKSFY